MSSKSRTRDHHDDDHSRSRRPSSPRIRKRDREREQVNNNESDDNFRHPRDRDRDRQVIGGDSPPVWRNVRVKEEPVSEDESGRRLRKIQRQDVSTRKIKVEDQYFSSSESNRHRDRDRERERDRERPSNRGYKRSRSRSPQREQEHRERDRGGRSRDRPEKVIKIEQRSRSRSRSPSRGGARQQSQHHHSRNDMELSSHASRGGGNRRDDGQRRHHDRDGTGDREENRPRDPKREQDWDNFFNPNSEMSQIALMKKEQEEAEMKEAQEGEEDDGSVKKEKEKPNFGLSGKLTEETNTFRGVVIKYSEPPEARKPQRIRWRLYPFKDSEALPTMFIHRQSAYLLGRERKIADIPIDHPSCSKQHAVIQFRLMPYVRPDGGKGRRIKPYVLDLESANGTYVNGDKIDPKRYVELFEKDVLKFGYSSREYVLLHEHSKDDPEDDTPGSSPEKNVETKTESPD